MKGGAGVTSPPPGQTPAWPKSIKLLPAPCAQAYSAHLLGLETWELCHAAAYRGKLCGALRDDGAAVHREYPTHDLQLAALLKAVDG